MEDSVEKTNALIVTRNETPIYSQGLGEARILIDGERSGGAWWLGDFREDPGFMTGLHFHYRQDEQFFVLEGVLSVYVDGKWLDLEPGTVAVNPHGMHHAQGNMGKKPVRFWDRGIRLVSNAFLWNWTRLLRGFGQPIRNSGLRSRRF